MTTKPKRPMLNRAAAIREFCLECMGFARQEINRCPDAACPLWEWRRGSGGAERTEVLIRRQGPAQSTGPTAAVEPAMSGDRGRARP